MPRDLTWCTASRTTERDTPCVAAALFDQARARVVNEYAAHHLRGDGEEVGAVLPAHLRLVNEAQVGVVDEGRGL
jgi:hypothetical protein